MIKQINITVFFISFLALLAGCGGGGGGGGGSSSSAPAIVSAITKHVTDNGCSVSQDTSGNTLFRYFYLGQNGSNVSLYNAPVGNTLKTVSSSVTATCSGDVLVFSIDASNTLSTTASLNPVSDFNANPSGEGTKIVVVPNNTTSVHAGYQAYNETILPQKPRFDLTLTSQADKTIACSNFSETLKATALGKSPLTGFGWKINQAALPSTGFSVVGSTTSLQLNTSNLNCNGQNTITVTATNNANLSSDFIFNRPTGASPSLNTPPVISSYSPSTNLEMDPNTSSTVSMSCSDQHDGTNVNMSITAAGVPLTTTLGPAGTVTATLFAFSSYTQGTWYPLAFTCSDNGKLPNGTTGQIMTSTQNVLFRVKSPQSGNSAPIANNVSVSTDERVTVSINLSCSDPDGDPLSYFITRTPGDGTLSAAGGTTWTYLSIGQYNGVDTFDYNCSDGSLLSNTATGSITVRYVNDPASAVTATITGTLYPGSGTVSLACAPVDADGVTSILMRWFKGGSAIANGSSYTAKPADVAGDVIEGRCTADSVVTGSDTVTVQPLPLKISPSSITMVSNLVPPSSLDFEIFGGTGPSFSVISSNIADVPSPGTIFSRTVNIAIPKVVNTTTLTFTDLGSPAASPTSATLTITSMQSTPIAVTPTSVTLPYIASAPQPQTFTFFINGGTPPYTVDSSNHPLFPHPGILAGTTFVMNVPAAGGSTTLTVNDAPLTNTTSATMTVTP